MLLKCSQPKTRTAYFFWLAQCFNLQHIITVSLVMMWVTGDEGASATFLCWHNRRHQSDFFFLSFFLIKYLCWVRISSFPVKPTHWKWTLSYFLSHSLDERENRTNEVAEKNKLDRLDLSEPSHCLPKKKGDRLNLQLTLGLISSHVALGEASSHLTSVASGHGYLEKILFV